MGGKGQYSIILWEKTKNQTAETFLQQRLEAASMEELQRLARQYASTKALPLSGDGNEQSLDGPFNSKLLNDTDEDTKVFTENPPQKIPSNTKQSAMFENTNRSLIDARLHDVTSMKANSESANNTGVETILKEVIGCKKQQLIIEEIKGDGQVLPPLQNAILSTAKDETCQITSTQAQKNQIIQVGQLKLKPNNETKNQTTIIQDLLSLENDKNKGINQDSQVLAFEKPPTNLRKRQTKYASADLQNQITQEETIYNATTEISQKDHSNNPAKRNLKSKQKEENKKEHTTQKKETIRCSSRKPLSGVDYAYFNNYGHKEIHEEMLNDKVRCETYKNAIEASVKGKIVLDVGAGTGFLSVIAAKAGATHVYAVEYSEMAEYAKQFINDNECTDNITLIKRRMEDVSTLDVPKVDVIISEWMGYFLLFENMLPSVIDARKRFLKEDGLMLPCEGRIYIAGVEWIGTEMNGVIMQPDKKSFNEAQVMLCSQDRVISNQCIISDFDLQESGNPLDNFGSQPFSFQLTKDATVNAFVGWFDVALTKEINLSTAPSQAGTHWKQVMFFLKKEIQAKVGDIIEGVLKMKAGSHNHRSLSIDLSYKLSSSKSVLKQSFALEQ